MVDVLLCTAVHLGQCDDSDERPPHDLFTCDGMSTTTTQFMC